MVTDEEIVEMLWSFPVEGEVAATNDPQVRKAVYDSHRGIDFWTRQSIPLGAMVLDHVVPKTMNGPDNVYNLVPTTKDVNFSKGERFDQVGTSAALAIIRINYAPKILKLLALIRAENERRQHGSEWTRRILPQTLAPRRIATNPIRHPVARYMEDFRVEFAESFQTRRLWSWESVADHLVYNEVEMPQNVSYSIEIMAKGCWLRVVQQPRLAAQV